MMNILRHLYSSDLGNHLFPGQWLYVHLYVLHMTCVKVCMGIKIIILQANTKLYNEYCSTNWEPPWLVHVHVHTCRYANEVTKFKKKKKQENGCKNFFSKIVHLSKVAS